MGERRDVSDGEPRYTLVEARRELAAQQCMVLGHQLRLVCHEGRWGQPEAVGCERCFTEWDVVPCRHGRGDGQDGDSRG